MQILVPGTFSSVIPSCDVLHSGAATFALAVLRYLAAPGAELELSRCVLPCTELCGEAERRLFHLSKTSGSLFVSETS